MISKTALLGLLIGAFVLGSDAGLVEVDDSGFTNDNRKGNDKDGVEIDSPFGNVDIDFNEGGISIVGPENPTQPGEKLGAEVRDKDEKEDKVISDPWRPFYDPENKNAFGQTFPKPEETPTIPKRPGFKFPEPEDTDSKIGGHQLPDSDGGFQTESPNNGHNSDGGFDQGHSGNGGFQEFPGVNTDSPLNGHDLPSNGGFQEVPDVQTENPNNGHHVSDNGGFQEYPDAKTTESPNNGHHVPGNGGFEQPKEPVEPHYPEPTTTKKPKDDYHPGSILGGILGGWKDKIHGWGKQTTKQPYTDDEQKGGHGGLGGILGGFKDAIESNKESVKKAVESVKEAGEKVVGAGKDVLEAGWKIGQSLGQNLNKNKDKGQKHSIFPGILGKYDEEEY